MSDSLVIALIGACALLAGHVLNQVFTYKLRIREFRVTQIQKWIDALESANFPGHHPGERNSSETKEEYLVRALESFSTDATAVIWSLYLRHKQIMNPAARVKFEPILDVSRQATGSHLVNDISGKLFGQNSEKSSAERLAATSHAAKLIAAYEEMRAASIDALYIQLRKEVGIK